MKIEKIKLVGFKSFVDKGEFTFEPGITAIVGPNGCGKSNISDAVRWVLGEQNPRLLRGGRMEDVIFHGSRTRAPVGMAEVSIIFNNDDGYIPLEFKEVEVTRRLFRSGESEYLINRVPCRLKDITETFMDTGIGMAFYSVLEQGQIDRILNSKPQERRVILEEAAGVSKYKHKKNEALKKLESTRQNLLRVGDILVEVSRQRNSLKRQVSKAKRYKAFQHESRVLQVCLAYYDLEQISAEKTGLKEKLKKRESDEILISAAISKFETELDEMKLKRVEAEKELSGCQQDLHQHDRLIDSCETKIKFSMQQIQDLESQKVSFVGEVSDLQKRTREMEEEIRRTNEQKNMVQVSLRKYMSDLTKNDELQTLQETNLEKSVRKNEELRARLFQLVSREQELHGNMQVNEERLKHLEKEIQEIDSKRTRSASLQQILHEEINRLNKLLMEKDEKLGAIKDKQHNLNQEIGKKRGILDGCNESLSGLQQELNLVFSRKESLEELVSAYEGFSDGVKTIMKTTGTIFHWNPGGVIADYIQTGDELDEVIEEALTDLLQTVLVQGYEHAREAIGYLKSNEKGRCRFMSIEDGTGYFGNGLDESWLNKPGVIGRLSDMVETRDTAPSVLNQVLRAILVVEDIDSALKLKQDGYEGRIMTKTGDTVEPDGIVVGGKGQRLQMGYLRRKREITRLKKVLTTLSGKISRLESKGKTLSDKLVLLETEQEKTDETIHELELERVNLLKDLEKFLSDKNQLEETIVHTLDEKKARELEREKLLKEQNELKNNLTSTVTTKDKLELTLLSRTDSINELRDKLENTRSVITRIKVKISGEEEKQVTLNRDLNRLTKELNHVKTVITAKKRKIEELNARIKDLYNQIRESENTLKEKIADREKLCVEVDKKRLAHETLTRNIEKTEKNTREQNMLLRPVIEELTEIRTQLNSLDMQYTHVKQKLEDITPQLEEESMERFKSGKFNPDESQARLDHLLKVMKKMGEINLAAIEEYEVLDERYRFLSTQKKDLEESINNLHETINRINKTTREKFMKCFHMVNQHFNTVFQELFEGGNAQLSLTEGQDVLEAGIEITVVLPGKKSQQLTLLSGGEKTMTALALLLAIYLYKPSPFCLMDEVDAALDDANTLRFLNILKKISQASQVIIVTHNKRTMENSDVIYGITMEEPGVSKMIAVRMAA